MFFFRCAPGPRDTLQRLQRLKRTIAPFHFTLLPNASSIIQKQSLDTIFLSISPKEAIGCLDWYQDALDPATLSWNLPLAPWTIQRLHLDSTLKDYSTKPTSAHRRSQLLYNIIFLNQVHFYHLQICQLHIIYYLFLNLLILYLSQILSTSRLIMPLQSRIDFGSSQGQPGTSGSNRNSTPSSSRPHRIRQSPSQHGNLISPSPDSRRRLSINTTPVPSKRVVEVLDGSSEDERVQPEKKKQKKKQQRKKRSLLKNK